MPTAAYKVVRCRDGWAIDHSGKVEGSYKTKEVAFEAAVLAASNAIKNGNAVTIHVPAPDSGEPVLG
jgi:hypothetical protein